MTRLTKWTGRSIVLLGLAAGAYVLAQGTEPDEPAESLPAVVERPMTASRLGELILNVDENAQKSESAWFFSVTDLEVIVVFDIGADRMRVMIPIGPADNIPEEELLRLMQANFDSALDARYAVGRGTLWGTFIHPLSALSDEEFLIGLGQTVNVVSSYGTSYSSGLFIFGSGDSAEIERQRLIEELKERT